MEYEEEKRKSCKELLQEEELRQTRKRILQEEEEESREINGYYLRLEYMREHCPGCSQEICRLLEGQQKLLGGLELRRSEFIDGRGKVSV